MIEQNNLILKGMNKTYDSLPSSYKFSDVGFTLLTATLKKKTGDDFDLSKDIVSMGFVTESGQVTNSGLLLCDQGYLKQSKVVCTRWKGIEKSSVEGAALDDEEFSGVCHLCGEIRLFLILLEGFIIWNAGGVVFGESLILALIMQSNRNSILMNIFYCNFAKSK